MRKAETFVLTLQAKPWVGGPPAVIRLRLALKELLRRHKLLCVGVASKNPSLKYAGSGGVGHHTS